MLKCKNGQYHPNPAVTETPVVPKSSRPMRLRDSFTKKDLASLSSSKSGSWLKPTEKILVTDNFWSFFQSVS